MSAFDTIAAHITRSILSLRRIWRLLLVWLITIAVVMALFPLVDGIYIEYFFSSGTIGLPAIVSIMTGGVVYLLGWYFLVNIPGDRPMPNRAIALYILAGIIALIIDVVLIAVGISMMDVVAG